MTISSASRKPGLVFMGTPQFAVPSLRALQESANYDIIAVITRPDKPAGRGGKLTPPPIKNAALEYSLRVFQPRSLKRIRKEATKTDFGRSLLSGYKSSIELVEFLNSVGSVDAIISVAYGQIIPSSLLDYAPAGIINVHPSLLPRWRGAAPIQRALFEGDDKTGVALIRTDEGLDTGPVYCAKEIPISETDTAGTLHDGLSELGAKLLLELLPDIVSGKLTPMPQTDDKANYADKWEKDDLTIHWSDAAEITLRRIRASSPYPGARTALGDILVKIFAAQESPDRNYPQSSPGTIVEVSRCELIVATGSSRYISLTELQFPGKKRLAIEEVLRGRSFEKGSCFT